MRIHLYILPVFCLIGCALAISCAGTSQVEDYVLSPINNVSDTFKGEQGTILRTYGLPDKAFYSSLGVTTWIYCNERPDRIVIRFDNQGRLLNTLPPVVPFCVERK